MLRKLDQQGYRTVHNNLRPLWPELDKLLEAELQTTYEALAVTTDPVMMGRLQGRVALLNELRSLPREAQKAMEPTSTVAPPTGAFD